LKKGSGYMVLKHVAFAPANKWGQIPFILQAPCSLQGKLGLHR